MNEKLIKSINIGVIAIALLFLTLIATPKISATETESVPVNAGQIADFAQTTGVWVVVTESVKPLPDRSIMFSMPGIVGFMPIEHKTDKFGVVYLRLPYNQEYKIADTKTGVATIINTGFGKPILINLDVTEYGPQNQNNEHPEGIFDLKVTVRDKHTNQPIPSAKVSYISEDYPEDYPSSTPKRLFTNDQGVAIIKYLPTGKYTFEILAINYVEQKIKNYFVGSTGYLEVDLKAAANFEQNLLDGHTNHLISFENCAVDKLKTIIPKDAVRSREEVFYKVVCEADGFIDNYKRIHYMSKDESYIPRVYLNSLDLTNYTQKQTPKVKLIFSTESGNKCYEKDLMLNKSAPIRQQYQFTTKLMKEDLLATEKPDMGQLIANCGIGKTIKLSVEIYDIYNKPISSIEHNDSINRIVIFANKEDIIFEDVNITIDNIDNQDISNRRMVSDIIKRERPEISNTKTPQISRESDIIQRERPEISNIEVPQISRESDIFVTIGNEQRQVVPIANILEERNINPNKIISDIKLEDTEYVFEVLKERKLLGFIPFGMKVAQERISATREIKE